MFIIFLIVVQAIIFLGHYVVYRVVTQQLEVSGSTSAILSVVFCLLSISFIAGSVLAYRGYSAVGALLYKGAAIWLGTILILFIILSIGTLISFVYPTISTKLIVVTGLLVSFGVVALGLYTAFHPRVTEVEITLLNLPAAWEGKRAVFFSDTHFGNVYGVTHSKKVVEQIKGINPEIIFMAGDFYDGPKINYREAALPFVELTPLLGKYYVTGNHEEYGDAKEMNVSITDVGFVTLNNEKKIVEGVQIIGLDYSTNQTEADQIANLARIQISSGTPSIMLKHVPLELISARDAGVSLQLSGHTHHGQLWPFSLLTRKIYNGFDYGLHTLEGVTNSLQVYTSSGTHSWGPPLRLGTKSEIVVITFKAK